MPFSAIGKGLHFFFLILNCIFILYLYLYSSSASLFLKTSDRKHAMYSDLMRHLETGDNIFSFCGEKGNYCHCFFHNCITRVAQTSICFPAGNLCPLLSKSWNLLRIFHHLLKILTL